MTDSVETKVFSSDPINFFCAISAGVICRLCLEKSCPKKLFDIFKDPDPIFKMIMSCASVQILQNDGFPSTICQTCLNKLNAAFQFKRQCETSDVRLRQLSRSYEMSFNESLTNKKSTENENLSSTKDETVKTSSIVEERKEEILKLHSCETCGKNFSRREYLTQHRRIHTGEKPYCCHICEKRFVNSGHLITHMRTHTGERPHPCTLCSKAFSTKQELHKHTMVHKGERPFVCNLCGKCFGSSSNLYSHWRHHTGEKNFTCEQCGKRFYTKQELKQHFLIHTGEKAFACEVCSKRFSQTAHLKRHLKLHS